MPDNSTPSNSRRIAATLLAGAGDEFAALEHMFDRPIAFHRILAKISGSVGAGVFLSQALYWHTRTRNDDGWFYKTQDEWEEETCLSPKMQKKARARWKELGILDEEARGLPRRLYYRIHMANLLEKIKEYAINQSVELVSPKGQTSIAQRPDKYRPLGDTYNKDARASETFSESTSETTHQEGACEDSHNAAREKQRLKPLDIVDDRETYCHAGRDGDCTWKDCPQNRDGEPKRSRRHCPLDSLAWEEENTEDGEGYHTCEACNERWVNGSLPRHVPGCVQSSHACMSYQPGFPCEHEKAALDQVEKLWDFDLAGKYNDFRHPNLHAAVHKLDAGEITVILKYWKKTRQRYQWSVAMAFARPVETLAQANAPRTAEEKWGDETYVRRRV